MKANGLLDRSRLEFRLADYRVGSAAALADPMLLSRVQEYRRLTGGRMMPLDRDDIRRKIPKADYFVSRKIDGEFSVLVYDGKEAFLINPGGTVRTGLPVTEEAARWLSKANVKQAMVAGELYVQCDDRRPRVHDVATVARQPKSEADLKRLRFAVFDLMPMDGAPAGPYAETWATIRRLFGAGERIHPVQTQTVGSADEVDKLFEKWVVQEGAEGLVARSDSAGLFKIKPRHTLDVAVIGFTESTGDREGMLHDLLYAVMRHDGTLQVLSRVGGGFDEDQRRTMLADLKDMAVASEYAEVNSDHVAYQMVEPQWVIEISCLDLISQTTRGAPINRMVLDFANNGSRGYRVIRRMPLATVISPQFIRRREDKSVRPHDVRIEQVSAIVEVTQWDQGAGAMAVPKSEVLRRTVYTKVMKGETMVRKLVLWKTNKAAEGSEYPAYVLHYTDFSPSRKTPMCREVRVSSSLEQMNNLWTGLLDENIKKGWELHASTAALSASQTATIAPAKPAPSPPEIAEAPEAPEAPAKPKKRAPKKPSGAEEVTTKAAPAADAAPAKKTRKKS